MKTKLNLFLGASLISASCMAGTLSEISELLMKSASGVRVSLKSIAQDASSILRNLSPEVRKQLAGYAYIGKSNNNRLIFVKGEVQSTKTVTAEVTEDEFRTARDINPAKVEIKVLQELTPSEKQAIAYRRTVTVPDESRDFWGHWNFRNSDPIVVIDGKFHKEIEEYASRAMGDSMNPFANITEIYVAQPVVTQNGLTHVMLSFGVRTAEVDAVVIERILANLMR